jgi:hypothetical protein
VTYNTDRSVNYRVASSSARFSPELSRRKRTSFYSTSLSQLLGDLLNKLAHEGRLIIASHHDLNTVPALFDEALVLATRALAFGPVEKILTPELVERTFRPPIPAA